MIRVECLFGLRFNNHGQYSISRGISAHPHTLLALLS